MAKTTNADLIKKIEEKAKQEQAQDVEKQHAEASADNPVPPDQPLSAEMDELAQKIMDSDEGANTPLVMEGDGSAKSGRAIPDLNYGVGSQKAAPNSIADAIRPSVSADKYAKARVSGEKLRTIALSYPLTTPDNHIVFGFGGRVFTLGDLRDLTMTRS